MSTGTKRSLDEARTDATALRALFGGLYDAWEIAGSVRRGKPEVGDVEHVIIPRPGLLDRIDELTEGTGLFGDDARPLKKAVYQNGTNRWGDRYRGVEFRGFKHELFFAHRDNFGAILAIRTGPAEFSKRMVTRLLSGSVYRQQNGYVISQSTGEIVACRDERIFFEMCDEPFANPEHRT